MKNLKLVLVAVVFMLLGGAPAQAAQGGPFGLGIILGEPSALNLKYDRDVHTAYDAGLSFNFDRYALIYADYQYKFNPISQLTPYLGVGAVVVISNRNDVDTRNLPYFTNSSSTKTALGIRVPLGVEWRPNAPIGIFGEIVPGLAIVPGTVAFVEGGLGIRFYF